MRYEVRPSIREDNGASRRRRPMMIRTGLLVSLGVILIGANAVTA
jgi:hypothetical protein